MGYPAGRPQDPEHRRKLSEAMSRHWATVEEGERDWGATGRKNQHATKDADGKSVQAKKAGNATAGAWGHTREGKSICGIYRMHCRWGSPVTNPDARKRLLELGKIDPKTYIPYRKDET